MAIDMNRLEAAVTAIRRRWPQAKPQVGVILGSGWSEIVDAFKVEDSLDYGDIPGLGKPGVEGHSGRLALVNGADLSTLFFQGRRHYYEGEGWSPIALPIYVLKQFGARALIITNAAGGVRGDLTPGKLMIIDDHINFMGDHPLIGPHLPVFGKRFPDQTKVYDPGLRALAESAAAGLGEMLAHGVYLAGSGPTYETPAEIRAFRTLGADAVGMSTVPEAMLANAAGLRVLAISCITNLAAGISPNPLSHEEVAEATRAAMPRMRALFQSLWQLLAVELAG